MVWNGTKFVFGNASAARYVNTYTPTVNVATTHTHSLAAGGDIIVQIYDTGTGELIHGEVIITSATTFDVIVTTADEIKVI
jgi:hypothetical protein